MKNRIALVLLLAAALLATLVFWHNTPKTFLKHIQPEDVQSIHVFDGGTGREFVIDAPEEIEAVVTSIQAADMMPSGLSLGRMGYQLRMSFFAENGGELVSPFILNSAHTIRKDPFFYRCDENLCFAYLKELEQVYCTASLP